MTIRLSDEAKQAASEMLPGYMVQPMVDYFEQGWQPGGFLTALLENDLVETFAHADATNKLYIHKYVQWLWWHAPGRPDGWGSPEAVRTWIREAQEERAETVD